MRNLLNTDLPSVYWVLRKKKNYILHLDRIQIRSLAFKTSDGIRKHASHNVLYEDAMRPTRRMIWGSKRGYVEDRD